MGKEVEGQRWDPDRYARNARFVSDLGAPLLDMLAPRAGERILDLGCGDGPLTLKLIAAGAEVLGIDSSAEQVAAARALGIEPSTVQTQWKFACTWLRGRLEA